MYSLPDQPVPVTTYPMLFLNYLQTGAVSL
nr:MAG TPA: hypothetical protein [Caudoviricetes sp.]